MSEDDTNKCCMIGSVFGYSLRCGVKFVAIATVMISSLSLFWSVASVQRASVHDTKFNAQPMSALDLVFGLYSATVSVYQILISILLYWKVETKDNLFITSLWFVSHLSILTFYVMLFVAKVALFVVEKQFPPAVFTAMAAAFYEGILLPSFTFVSWLTVIHTPSTNKYFTEFLRTVFSKTF